MLRLTVLNAADYWTERTGWAMGSGARILLGDADDEAVDWAFAELDRLERCWTRFRPDSELSRLNASAGSWMTVTDLMLTAIDRCTTLWQATGGAFDPTILRALVAAGYDRTFEKVRSSDEPVPPAVPAPGWPLVQVDHEQRAVLVPPGVALDLGGIGKGLAADLVASGLVERGVKSALVSIGGDVRVAGVGPEGGWQVPVEDPQHPGCVLFECALESDALVLSTTRLRRWVRDGAEQHHIIDPSTGAPARTDLVGVVVEAEDAWFAEGIAKAVIVLGASLGRQLLRRVGVRGWLLTRDPSETLA